MSTKLRATFAALTLTLVATPALAHPGHGEAAGFIAGLLHPIAGTDHLLAIVSVGVLAGLTSVRALVAVPAVFVVFMVAGGVLGMSGLALPFVEAAIALSVVIFGLLVASGARLGLTALIGVAAVAALFHGAAHGGELPAGADSIRFSLGFLSSTVVMLAAGLAAGLGIARTPVPVSWLRPVLGLSTATAGVSLFVL